MKSERTRVQIADAVITDRPEFDTTPMGLVVWSLIIYLNSSNIKNWIMHKHPSEVYLITELGDMLL